MHVAWDGLVMDTHSLKRKCEHGNLKSVHSNQCCPFPVLLLLMRSCSEAVGPVGRITFSRSRRSVEAWVHWIQVFSEASKTLRSLETADLQCCKSTTRRKLLSFFR